MDNDYILECQGITKRFGSVTALNNVNFKVRRGEIHVLCGENGAGKSTLMNVISGVYPHGSYEGKFLYNGEECRFGSVSDSEDKGIAIIHQHLALFPLLSVAENIFINNEFAHKGIINWNETRRKAQELIDSIGINVSPTTLVKDIGVGKRQLVEICKAISRDVKLLILDEPTAALNDTRSRVLLNMLLDFKKRGITSILITHKLNEIGKVCDTITVLRDGATIETLEKGKDDISIGHIVKAMVGREMTNLYPEREHNVGDVLFEVKDWTVFDPLHIDIEVLHKVSFNVRKGRGAGHCRPDGRRPHRAGDEHLRQELRPEHLRRALPERQEAQHTQHGRRHQGGPGLRLGGPPRVRPHQGHVHHRQHHAGQPQAVHREGLPGC